jgi:quinol monooxygenase YgiN
MDPSADGPAVVAINVFTVDPGNQQRLVDLLTRATESGVRQVPGFVSATLHRGLDGTRVTMYARWRSAADYQRMRENPGASPYLEETLTFATFDPGLYEVVATFLPSG